jgi:Xaa-Pro aminopeptidase
MTPAVELADRIGRARRLMAVENVDVLLVSLGRDLLYLTGYEAPPLERLTMAVIPRRGVVTLLVPELEAAKVVAHPDVFELRPWRETDDPIALVVATTGGAKVAAIGDQTWASFLLALQERMSGTRFISARVISTSLRLRKTAAEAALLRQAGAAADRVALRLARVAFAGRSEADIAREVSSMMIEEGHEYAPAPIVAAGPNSASPHHQPGSRVIESGDAVIVDFGGTIGGYHSDTTRMFYVGEPGVEVRHVHGIVKLSQDAGFAAAVAGNPAQDVDRAARGVIDGAGYADYFIHRTGHGIGLDMHEEPYIVEGNETPLAPGMAFSIEPGIYMPGQFGVRIEDIVMIGPDGPERMNNSPREPVVVE